MCFYNNFCRTPQRKIDVSKLIGLCFHAIAHGCFNSNGITSRILTIKTPIKRISYKVTHILEHSRRGKYKRPEKIKWLMLFWNNNTAPVITCQRWIGLIDGCYFYLFTSRIRVTLATLHPTKTATLIISWQQRTTHTKWLFMLKFSSGTKKYNIYRNICKTNLKKIHHAVKDKNKENVCKLPSRYAF